MSCRIKTGSRDDLLKVQIEGSATWENAIFFSDFIKKILYEGKVRVLLDLSECTFMDSTYFGVLAELAELALSSENGEFYIANMSPRVLEEVRTLGLDKLASIADESVLARFRDIEATQTQFDENYSRLQKAKQILKAHQALESLGGQNTAEFRNVVEYFRNYIEKHSEDPGSEKKD
jgi:anti-sigma B factor antagonist